MKIQPSRIKLIKENYPYLQNEFGIEKIGFFGSVIKGNKEENDIDIVVSFKGSIGLKFIELAEYLEKLFQKKVDILTQEGIDNIRVKEVAEEIKKDIIYV